MDFVPLSNKNMGRWAPFFEHFLLIFLHLLEQSLFRTALVGFKQIWSHPLLHVLQPPLELLQATLKPEKEMADFNGKFWGFSRLINVYVVTVNARRIETQSVWWTENIKYSFFTDKQTKNVHTIMKFCSKMKSYDIFSGLNITCGVLQGSVLGPKFVYFTHNFLMLFFADDKTILCPRKNLQ